MKFYCPARCRVAILRAFLRRHKINFDRTIQAKKFKCPKKYEGERSGDVQLLQCHSGVTDPENRRYRKECVEIFL